jgi:hypothetical protein
VLRLPALLVAPTLRLQLALAVLLREQLGTARTAPLRGLAHAGGVDRASYLLGGAHRRRRPDCTLSLRSPSLPMTMTRLRLAVLLLLLNELLLLLLRRRPMPPRLARRLGVLGAAGRPGGPSISRRAAAAALPARLRVPRALASAHAA